MKKTGTNFSLVDLGPFAESDQYMFKHPLLPKAYPGKKFLKDELGLTGLEISVNKMPAGRTIPFKHRHRENEELYLFLKGEGQMYVDGEWLDVCEGTTIRVAPKGIRTLRSSPDSDLHFIVIQAKAGTLLVSGIEDGMAVQE